MHTHTIRIDFNKSTSRIDIAYIHTYMAKREVIVEVEIHDDIVSSIEDLERVSLHPYYGTFRLDFLYLCVCPKS